VEGGIYTGRVPIDKRKHHWTPNIILRLSITHGALTFVYSNHEKRASNESRGPGVNLLSLHFHQYASAQLLVLLKVCIWLEPEGCPDVFPETGSHRPLYGHCELFVLDIVKDFSKWQKLVKNVRVSTSVISSLILWLYFNSRPKLVGEDRNSGP